ncbi:MAG: radical SAM protein [bacterium]
MKVVLVIPPFTQINTTYPSVTQLAGYLLLKGYDVKAIDLSLNVFLKIFSAEGLLLIQKQINNVQSKDEYINRSISLFDRYIEIIDPVIKFLQGNNPSFANIIVKDGYIPQGKVFPSEENDNRYFGEIGVYDRAKHYCALMMGDINNVINAVITPHFNLSRYAESLAQSPPTFDNILDELNKEKNIIEEIIINETEKLIKKNKPDVIGFSIPFPGNLFSALLSSQYIKQKYPQIKIIFGGGYINTELRKLSDIRIFKYVDYITFDDGELPIHNILNNLKLNGHNQNRVETLTYDEGKLPLVDAFENLKLKTENHKWVRTLTIEDNSIVYYNNADEKDIPFKDLTAPSYKGIEINKYVSMLEMLNPMHRLWSDGYWNKLAVAHGCYWQRCTFCDTTLDYIKNYAPAETQKLIKIINSVKAETGKNTFHFTDEAAPPSKLKDLAIELIKNKTNICWWGNIRFDKYFTNDLCRLLSYAGCIAVSGGIEIAEERLLDLIDKGVTVEQAATVTNNFRNANILVHSYLMYGYPTQTELETINSLEMVRQFIKHELIQSAFWHRFALTIHSPIANNPNKYGIKIISSQNNPFANNDLIFTDNSNINHNKYSDGLKYALYNYMHGVGLDWNINKWFGFSVTKPTVDKSYVANILKQSSINLRPDKRKIAMWEGGLPEIIKQDKNKKVIKAIKGNIEGLWEIDSKIADWIKNMAAETIEGMKAKNIIFEDWENSFPYNEERKIKFYNSKCWEDIRNHFLIIV